MILCSGFLVLVPALGSLVAAALCPDTGQAGQPLDSRAVILVPALGSLV